MDALAAQGYTQQHESAEVKTWRLTPMCKQQALALQAPLAAAARLVMYRHGKKETNTVLDEVYERFPWFTINSQRRQLQTRPLAAPAVFTSGYEGESVDGFLNRLLLAGVQRILDVRNNPVSRRYGFHKSTLAKLSGWLGLDYVHLPELGIPSELRQELNTQADYDRLFTKYRSATLVSQKDAIQRTAGLMMAKPSVLVCMEALPCRCHRSHLADPVAAECSLAIQHLTVP